MVPKIQITYSPTYDYILHLYRRKRYTRKKISSGIKYSHELKKILNKILKKFFKILKEITGIEWHDDEKIKVYIVTDVIYPFADPLTIPMKKKKEEALVFIIHELIHLFLISNKDRIKWKEFYKKYGDKKDETKNHILLYAILFLLYPKLFGKKAQKLLKFEKWWERYDLPLKKYYLEAWKIVEKEGPEKIIKELINRK